MSKDKMEEKRRENSKREETLYEEEVMQFEGALRGRKRLKPGLLPPYIWGKNP
ncbi:MAG: hypothetical protein ACP5KZ_03730 [bacterium]